MTKEINHAKELIDFIYNSPTAFHAVESIKNILINNKFIELNEGDRWNLNKGGNYFITKNKSALVAFQIPTDYEKGNGFKIIGSHTDSPSFKIKPKTEIISEKTYIKLNTEVYGGAILSTWFDRPLSIAGRVTIKGEDVFNLEDKLINIKKPIAIIPNLAIHMNRNVNNGVKFNPQIDTLPIIGLINEQLENNNYLLNIISKELKINIEDIIDFELYLYEYEKGNIIGINNEFISCSRLDDLEMVHAGLTALISSNAKDKVNVLACFDNEEVGSSTKQGADSSMLKNILERITICFGGDREDFIRSFAKSFMISSDSAHAVHPNKGEKSDITNRPKINKGPAIKLSASQSYTSDSNSAAIYETICKRCSVPVQKFVNRSDERGGSTIGPISATHLDINCVDIGTPVLAMHSIRELCGVLDHYYVTQSFIEFFNI